MPQDPFPYPPVFACTKLGLFEAISPESGNYTGLLCGLFAKRSFSSFYNRSGPAKIAFVIS